MTRLIPKESMHTKTEFRYKLKPGPGVDFCGQMPIPHELLMKRGAQKPKYRGRKISQDETIPETDKRSLQKGVVKK